MIWILFSFKSNAQQRAFSISGVSNGAEGKWMYLSYRDEMNKSVKDSAKVIDHHFKFSGYIPSAIMVNFFCKTCAQGKYTSMFIEPTEMQLILDTSNFEKIKLSGSKSQKEYESYLESREYIFKDMRPIQARYEASNDNYIKANRRGASIDELDSLAKITKSLAVVGRPTNNNCIK